MQILDADPHGSAVPLPSLIAALPHEVCAPSAQVERVIQTYRGIVNCMADLLLRLDLEGPSDALQEALRDASRRSVRPPSMVHQPICLTAASSYDMTSILSNLRKSRSHSSDTTARCLA